MLILINNIDKIITILLMISSSIYIRLLLQTIGQTWIKTTAHTATLTLLPILTYIITNVISGNIALSLGMVGALSIVRFRNPVRSPLELSVYFGAITMGITAAVSLNWLVLLIASVTFVTFVLSFINIVSKKITKNSFFISSFSEGNNLCSLVVLAQDEIKFLDESENLSSKIASKDEITYTLTHTNFTQLKKIENQVQAEHNFKSIQLSR